MIYCRKDSRGIALSDERTRILGQLAQGKYRKPNR